MKKIGTLLTACAAFALISTTIFADPNGKVKRTSLGCGSGCHGSAASTAVTNTITDANGGTNFTVTPGGTISLKMVVAHASNPSAGFNAAVLNSAGANAGTLAADNDSFVRVSQSEVTQSSPKTMTGGKATFSFKWTAPTTPGQYTVHAVGNAVNGNGVEDAGDHWSIINPVTITVQAGSSVEETPTESSSAFMSAFPNPTRDKVSLTFVAESTGLASISIVDMQGRVVNRFDQTIPGKGVQTIELQTISTNGASLVSGLYRAVVEQSNGEILTAPIVIER